MTKMFCDQCGGVIAQDEDRSRSNRPGVFLRRLYSGGGMVPRPSFKISIDVEYEDAPGRGDVCDKCAVNALAIYVDLLKQDVA